jgi:hypothetical protein
MCNIFNILQVILLPNCLPSIPSDLRLKSINVICDFLRLVYNENIRILPFSKRVDYMIDNGNTITGYILKYYNNFLIIPSMRAILNVLIDNNVIDDSKDEIRITSLYIITYLLPIITSEENTDHSNVSNTNTTTTTTTTTNNNNTNIVTYENLLSKLIYRLYYNNPSNEFLIVIENVLRSFAILNPNYMMSIISQQIDDIQNKKIDISECNYISIYEILNNIIDHCEMLQIMLK